MISAEQIAQVKKKTKYGMKKVFHEHDDCIRIAYEWLDAQKKTKGISSRLPPLKQIIENWAGRYISESDVEVAAVLHPDIKGNYPYFNISSSLVRPSDARLVGIAEARTQARYKINENDHPYSTREV